MDYRDLLFYQKSREVVIGINKEICNWPKTTQAYTISRQLFRAATSVGANIAEGHGRHKGLEYIHYLRIAQGSANEVDHWLNVASDIQLGNTIELRRLIQLNIETRKMLNSSIRSLERNLNKKQLKELSRPYSPIPYPPNPLFEDADQ